MLTCAPMLTLIVPGLLWPRQALIDLTHDLDLPALSILLGRGRLTRLDESGGQDALAQALGLAHPLPCAALRALAEGESATTGDWLALDPVHLRIEQTRVQLDDPQNLALDEAEAQQFAVSLEPTFRELGQLIRPTPLTWNLRLNSPATLPAPLIPLTQAIGRTVLPMPATPANRRWQAALTEAQMVLHAHPVNRAREASGRPVVNTLWPWGGGSLSAAPASRGHPYRHLLADDPVARGAGIWLNLTTRPLAAAAPFAPATLIFYDRLARPAQLGQATPWREALRALENEWLSPLLADLRSGRLATLRLLLPGEPEGYQLDIRRHDLLRIWRRPVPLATLARP